MLLFVFSCMFKAHQHTRHAGLSTSADEANTGSHSGSSGVQPAGFLRRRTAVVPEQHRQRRAGPILEVLPLSDASPADKVNPNTATKKKQPKEEEEEEEEEKTPEDPQMKTAACDNSRRTEAGAPAHRDKRGDAPVQLTPPSPPTPGRGKRVPLLPFLHQAPYALLCSPTLPSARTGPTPHIATSYLHFTTTPPPFLFGAHDPSSASPSIASSVSWLIFCD